MFFFFFFFINTRRNVFNNRAGIADLFDESLGVRTLGAMIRDPFVL